MKKLFAVLLAAGLSIPAYAEQVNTPSMAGDNPSLEYAGVSTCRLIAADSTTGKLCSSASALVYGVSFSSVASTAYVSLFSTNAVDLGGAVAKKLQWNDDNNEDEGAGSAEYRFVAPIKFPLGLVARTSSAVTAGPQSEIVIYYRAN